MRIPPAGRRVEIPTGILLCPNDLSIPAPEQWIRRMYADFERRVAPRGGHFLAFEEPGIFADEVRRFFRTRGR